MIRLEGVTKTLGSQRVLDGLSFEVRSGEHLVIEGPSGSGKTTLLRVVAGLEDVDRGSVWLDGQEVSKPGFSLAPHLRSIGFAFQAPALWPHMTVRQHLDFAGPRCDARLRDELVQGLGLQPFLTKVPHQLSGGEARRVALARAMISQPRRLLLDEAFSHLDEDSKKSILAFVIDRVRAWGTTMLFVTHDSSEAERVAGTTLRMRRGGAA